MADVEQRVSVIEQDLKNLAYAQLKTEMSLQSLSEEMREFRGEMATFKDEMAEFKDEMRADRKRMNREWGNLANKMGTIVEDIILPGFSGILKQYFGIEPDLILPRPQRKDPNDSSRMREFDILAVSDTHLFVNETKSRPSVDSAKAFAGSYRDVLTFFPEYSDRTIVPIYSALTLSKDIVEALSNNGCYAVALGDEHLELLNFDAVGPPRPLSQTSSDTSAPQSPAGGPWGAATDASRGDRSWSSAFTERAIESPVALSAGTRYLEAMRLATLKSSQSTIKPLFDVMWYLEHHTVLNGTLAWGPTGEYDPRLTIDIDSEVICNEGGPSRFLLPVLHNGSHTQRHRCDYPTRSSSRCCN